MKVSRVFIITGILLMTFGFFLDSNTMYLTDSISAIEVEEEKEEQPDISGVAYNVDNVISGSDISGVAKNIKRVEVYDGMTINELSRKLNKSLKGVLANKGKLIATRCLKYGIDPYVAVAIMLHETGCNARCSTLSTKYYNVGGMRGRGGYMHFSSIDEGIKKFIDNLYYGYYRIGLNTPEKMNKKYAGSTSWAGKVNAYVKAIKNK